jgi:hypothetical protein
VVKVFGALIWVLFGFFSVSVYAQTTLVSNQAGLAQKKSQYRKALGQSEGQVYTVYSSNADLSLGFVIERYSQDMIFQSDRKIEAQGKQRILRLVLGDSFFYWISVVKVKRQVYRLFYHRLGIDMLGTVVSKELYTVSAVDMDIANWETVSSVDRRVMGIFSFSVSAELSEEGRKLTLAHGLTMNQSGDLLDSFRVTLSTDFGIDEVVWRSAEVKKNGEMALVYEDQVALTIFNARKEQSHFHVISRSKQRTQQQRLSAVGMIRELALSLDPSTDEFLLCGFWSDWKQTEISGHVNGWYRPEREDGDSSNNHWFLTSYVWSDWDCKQMSGLLSTKKMSKPENYFIREIIPLSHGGSVWLSEQFYETRQMETYYVNGVPQTSSKLFYHYGDVAAMYMNANGQLDTLVMIRKSQVGTASNAYLHGFAHYVCAGSLNVVYNDDEGEMNRVMHVKIDNTFVSEKEWLFRSENIPGAIVPYEGLHSDYCTLTVPIYRDKQWHWLQVFSND